jgi:3-methyladenine DNA glycosylase AlkD
LVDAFRVVANPQEAVGMKAYMRDQFEFFGVKAVERRMVFKGWVKENGLPSVAELPGVVDALYGRPERELHYCAVELVEKMATKLDLSHLGLAERLITENSWWDTVDTVASHVVAPILLKSPGEMRRVAEGWSASGNLWLRRVSIIFQLPYKGKTDVDLLFDMIRRETGSNEFFIQKAIGWSLRQYAYTDAAAVREFLGTHELKPLSVREAMKHL